MPLGYYADEDCPGPVVRAMRAAGFDVVAQGDIQRGAADDDVMRLAAMSRRVLLSRDLGFGRLAVVERLTAVGVIIIRLRGPGDWSSLTKRVVEAVSALGDNAEGQISVIDWHATRLRPLPRRA